MHRECNEKSAVVFRLRHGQVVDGGYWSTAVQCRNAPSAMCRLNNLAKVVQAKAADINLQKEDKSPRHQLRIANILIRIGVLPLALVQPGSDFFGRQRQWYNDVDHPGACAEFVTIDFPGIVLPTDFKLKPAVNVESHVSRNYPSIRGIHLYSYLARMSTFCATSSSPTPFNKDVS